MLLRWPSVDRQAQTFSATTTGVGLERASMTTFRGRGETRIAPVIEMQPDSINR
jgi:hypothetical protein